MALSTQVTHRSSALKQQNKKHKTLGHRTKGQLKAPKGRESVKSITKKFKKDLSRDVRKHKAKQLRTNKREETLAKKRSLGTQETPPFLVTIVPLNCDINPRVALESVCSCDVTSTTTVSDTGIRHLNCAQFKQRFAFIIPPVDDLYAILDSVKVSDTVLFLWCPDEDLNDSAELILSSILAQGLPSPVHAVLSMDHFSQKKQRLTQQRLLHNIQAKFPTTRKVYCLNKEQDALLLLRQIGSQKQRSVFYRDYRPHLIAESLSFEGNGVTGTMKVTGHVRGQVLSVNDLVHIPGLGEFQLSQIDCSPDPTISKKHNSNMDEDHVYETADPSLQETLQSVNEVDPMEGEQTWPTAEELLEAQRDQAKQSKTKTKRVPKGTSEYQAAWILDSEDEGSNDDSDGEYSMEDSNYKDYAPLDAASQDDNEEEWQDVEDYETMTMTDIDEDDYDNNTNMVQEMDALEKFRAARDDARFPDEIDTPHDTPAHIRFQKYRGLESFRTSTWDVYENLPMDYSKIFQFHNFRHTRKQVLNGVVGKTGVFPGWYVTLHISEVPRHMYDNLQKGRQGPTVIFGILRHEQKMSVLNLVLKSHHLGHYRAIKSKERLVYHIGFRRFANCAIFSEHSTGNKHKYFRFFHPGQTVVATMFAPITFPPASVLVFRERSDGGQDLVATGSLLSVDPTRLICKRTVLSGHPFKVNKKSAVVRYMFFNRQDVEWFKPVQLRTKWGRRGNIKEPLGTHGHMKCFFDGPLKSQDTILMNLYKRVFPKWTFDPCVMRPPSLYHTQLNKQCSDVEDDDDNVSLNESRHKSKKRKVHFASTSSR